MNSVISVDRLSKLYQIGVRGASGYRTLRESIAEGFGSLWSRPKDAASSDSSSSNTYWALRDVSFEIQPGEVVGIIGRNGAGKSTLLKILSQITQPHSGRVTLHGRVGSLLEVGVGFHPELTGRENIHLNGAIFGMSRREIRRKFDEIIAFAEIESFLDTPVKRYSSGMYVRLAFAVAAHMDPEILLVDEVLAVGDSSFQSKCLGKMGQVSRSGRTVLFVSHNMAAICNLCSKVIVLDRGRLMFEGPSEKGIGLYANRCSASSASETDLTNHPNRRVGSTPLLSKIRLLSGSGEPTQEFGCGEPMLIELDVDPSCKTLAPHFAVGFDDIYGSRLFTVATYLTASWPTHISRPRSVVCRVDQLPLCHGRYSITLNAGPIEARWMDMIDQAVSFEVVTTDFYGNGRAADPEWGRFLVRSHWQARDV